MTVLVVVCVILLIAGVLAALLSVPLRLGVGAAAQSAAIPAESADTRARLAALVPGSNAIVGALPKVAVAASLQVAPLDPPPADLSTIGCGEDKDETAAAVWREARRAIAQRSGKTSPAGGR